MKVTIAGTPRVPASLVFLVLSFYFREYFYGENILVTRIIYTQREDAITECWRVMESIVVNSKV